MKYLVPAAVLVLVAATYILFYLLTSFESQESSSFGLVNTVGLVFVFVGVVAAAVLFRRFSVPK